MKAPFSHLQPGVRVKCAPTGAPGKFEPDAYHGLVGTFLGWSKPHGYARVAFDGRCHRDGTADLVHPESLVLEEEGAPPPKKTEWTCRCKPRCGSLGDCHNPQTVRPEEA